MQKQLKRNTKSKPSHTKTKNKPGKKQVKKGDRSTMASKNIKINIEREMAARVLKFNEGLACVKVDPRFVKTAGGKKPGTKRDN